MIILAFVCILLTSGCTEYWRTRGQAPSVEALVERAQDRLSTAEKSSDREKIKQTAKDLEKNLVAAYRGKDSSEIKQQLAQASESFATLEGKLSYGSRPAYGELSGQLRALANAEKAKRPAVGLFAARTLFFLADELSVPAPAEITYKKPTA